MAQMKEDLKSKLKDLSSKTEQYSILQKEKNSVKLPL